MHPAQPAAPRALACSFLPAACAALVLTLSACGGGSGSDAGTSVFGVQSNVAAPASVPAPTTTAVSVTAIDGALSGVTVCLDLNSNGVCDSGEPSAKTNASGQASLTVPNAQAGKFPIVAMVPVGAVDADNGPVSTGYVMQAPADQPSLVSPLTTLVQAQMALSGASSAEAAAVVQQQGGLGISAFVNYSSSLGNGNASHLARLVVLAMQDRLKALAPLLGQADLSGNKVAQADLQSDVTAGLLGALPRLAAAANDPNGVAAATPAAVDTALSKLLTALNANGQIALTSSNALAAIGAAKLPPMPAASGQATASLRAMSYFDASNWYFRAMEGTWKAHRPTTRPTRTARSTTTTTTR